MPMPRRASSRRCDRTQRSEFRPMAGPRSYKPQTGVRFPQLRRFSPIEGREPAFEAGDAGSIPARGARTVAVVYWSARLAVNEEVRVRSPPVTPARSNWVWVNGWPPGPEPGPRRFDSCRPDGSRTRARPRRPCGLLGNVGALSRRRTGFDSRQGHNVPLVYAANDAGLSNRRTGFDSPMGHHDRFESAAEWSATGPENRGGGDEPQRFDSSTLVRT